MKVEDYIYACKFSKQDGCFVATCLEFPSLRVTGHTEDGALIGIKGAVHLALNDMTALGHAHPKPKLPAKPNA